MCAFIQKQTVSLSFQGGLNSKTDALQLQPPALLGLKNARFDKLGALNKRPGYNIFGNQIMSDGQITSAVALSTFNNELNLFDNTNIYSYISQVDAWANRGPAISIINTNNQIIRSAADQQLNPDVASLQDIKVFAWEDSRGGVRYSVLDTDENAYIVADKAITGSLARPKLITFNNLIYLFYTSNNNLYYRTINPNTPNILSPAIAAIADGYTDFKYDACASITNNEIFIAYFTDTSVTGFALDTAGNINDKTVIVTGTNAIEDVNSLAISIVLDSQNSVWISWSTGQRIFTVPLDTTFGGNTPYLIDTVQCPMITAIESINIGSLQLIYEIHNATASNESVKSYVVDFNGTTHLIGHLLSVGLSSKPYLQNQEIFVNLAYQSTLQNTYFTTLLTNVPFTIVAKIAAQVGGGLRTNGMLSEVVQIKPSVFLWSNLVKGRFISEDHTNFSLLGVNGTTADYTDPNKFNSITFSDNQLIVGGILQSYDGVSVVEQNFNVYPEDIGYTILPGAGALSAGQYQYQIVYSWTDKFGQIQYSTPSPTLTITTIVNDAIQFTLPTLRLTAKTGVVIKIYRTQVNGVVFQEVTSELAPTLNNTSVNTIIFTDTLADAQITANQVIYTASAVPNTAPPSCALICRYNDRVILGGLEDPNLLWFSKNQSNTSNSNTIPVEFSELFTIVVNNLGGPITALGLMDQNLIIWKESAIFIMNGDGPNDQGGGGNFSPPQLISQSVGCTNPNSVQLTTEGIIFQTPHKGMWMLPRSLGEPQYLPGVDTEAKSYLISSSNLDVNSTSVIFTTINGPALVYDYLIGQWGTWTNHQAADAVIFDGEFSFVKSNGSVYQQDQTIFYDGYVSNTAIPYSMEIITPWLSYAHNLGYQSIFRFFILGQYRGAHNLNVAVGYNYDPNFATSAVIDATSLVGSSVWGAGSTWGSPTPWGGSWSPYIFQVNTSVKRCSSFRIKLFDSQVQPYNEGLTLNNLLLELGIIGDGVRVPATNKVAAK